MAALRRPLNPLSERGLAESCRTVVQACAADQGAAALYCSTHDGSPLLSLPLLYRFDSVRIKCSHGATGDNFLVPGHVPLPGGRDTSLGTCHTDGPRGIDPAQRLSSEYPKTTGPVGRYYSRTC